MSTRVLIVDDHPLMQRGLRVTLDAELDLSVTSVVSSGEEALTVLDEADPNVALVDVSLPGMDGVELVRHLFARRPRLAVLVVSRHDDDLYAERVVRAGARGYLSKVEAAENVVDAVRTVLSGRLYLRDEIKDRLITGRGSDDPLAVLSDRELQVFEMVGRGLSASQIADSMALSVKTIETYRARIKDKLGLENARDLLRHASRWTQEGA